MVIYTIPSGRVTCTQCNALSKRTRQRCKAPAVKGKTKRRFHGGAKGSGRPVIHGRETREKRAERSAKLAELRELEELGFKVGLFAEGTPRTRGENLWVKYPQRPHLPKQKFPAETASIGVPLP